MRNTEPYMSNFLTWENFSKNIMVPGEQRTHRISNNPAIEIYHDGTVGRTGLLIETHETTNKINAYTHLESIRSQNLFKEGKTYLSLSTDTEGLQKQFYHLANAISERIIVEKQAIETAIIVELACFNELLKLQPLLSFEKQIGLVGELIVLEKLTAKYGISAINSWIGPEREPHDFKIKDKELEVKTTVSTRRIHTINGMEQLVASENCQLFLVSVLIGPPGASDSFSLPDIICRLENAFSADSIASDKFHTLLAQVGYKTSDAAHYVKKFNLRRPVEVFPVDANFPAITRDSIESALGEMASRISSLTFDVNIEGLDSKPISFL